MPVRIAWAVRRRWAPMAMVAAGAVGLVGAGPAAAGHPARHAEVDCHQDPSALRNAIASAPSGATLLVEGTCIGRFVITRDLTLIGRGHAVLDGNHTHTTVEIGARVRLARLTIAHGSASAGGGVSVNFGGMATLDHSTVKDNTAQEGGGIFNSEGATLTLDHSTVKDNTATTHGGGIDNPGTMTLTGSTVKDNTAQQGGGIYNFGGTARLELSTVRRNRATNQGGGIFNDHSGRVTLARSTARDNTAGGGPGSGGGIFNGVGTVTLDDSRVRHNHPDNCAPHGSVPGCKD
ncbi:right-handed parallel beta-helix repeat-containing protein [Streptomyces sp. NPDC020096]